MKKSLKFREVERLENTSIAATLFGIGPVEAAGPIFCVPEGICVDSVSLPPMGHTPLCVEGECVVNSATGGNME